MKLSDYLNASEIATLRQIATYNHLDCSMHSKLSLLQAILFSFRNKAFLKEQIECWTRTQGATILRVCLDARSTFSKEEFHGMLQKTDVATNMEEVLRQGWLFAIRSDSTSVKYCVPDDLQADIRRHVITHLSDQLVSKEDGPLVFQEEGSSLVRDLDVFLEYVAHHDVQLTADGSMYKRNLSQVLDLLEVKEMPLAGGWRFGYGRRFHDYPNRFALIYDYAYQYGIIEETPNGLLHVTDQTETWRALGELKRQQSLLKFYLSVYRRPIPRLIQIVQITAYCAIPWISQESMHDVLDHLLNDYYYDTKQDVFEQRILNMLMYLGIIRIGVDEDESKWFQITQVGQELLTPNQLPDRFDDRSAAERILIVQPNFEVIVTGDQPMVTAGLAKFTELRQTGAIRVYRMTEDTIMKAVGLGMTPVQCLEFLIKHAQTDVPGNVEHMLQEWQRRMLSDEETLTS